ncbi:MAG: Hin recombinase [Oscillospiraceae bacterium]|nr:Hin recombinase [Oscillospiraceae bacterium]
MNTDYRKLCMDLFGTDDVNELKKLAKNIKAKNPRNAGRKKKFTQNDICKMQAMIANGMTINEVAAQFGTSRQIVGKYLNTKPEAGYTLRMTYMYQQHPCTLIDVDFLNEKIKIENRTADILHRAFGAVEEPTWDDFEWFLKDRCFPATRGNVKDILLGLQLTDYDPLQIVEKTKGRTAEDDMWLKFAYYPKESTINA